MLLRVFLLSFLLLAFSTTAQSRDTASDIFSGFANGYLNQSKLEDAIGPNGLNQIIENTKNWKTEDAHFLINSLTDAGLTPHNILKAIWVTVTFVFPTENYEETEDVSGVFFEFASSHLTDIELEIALGDGWLDDVIEHTQKWREEDAQHLTNSLKKAGIEPENTLKAIRVIVSLLQKPAGPIVSETIVETQQTTQENPIREENTAAKVFIDFAREHRGENFEREMGSQWKEKITENTSFWTAQDAIDFLDYLVDLIGVDLALTRIRSTSYFSYMHYKDFKDRVDFYKQENYLGEEGIRKKLSQSFSGLHTGDLADIRNTIQQVQNIIGEEGIKKIFNKPKVNLGAFAIANTEIVHIVNWLEDIESGYGIPMAQISEAIIRDPEAFTKGRLANLARIAAKIRPRLNKYGLPGKTTLTEAEIEAKINEIILRSPQALTTGKVKNLEDIVDEIKKRLNEYGLSKEATSTEVEFITEIETKVNEAILKDPGAFTKGKVENLTEIIKEIRDRLKRYGLLEENISDTAVEQKINEAILNSPGAFTKGKVQNLRAIANEIINQFTGHEVSEELNIAIGKQINEAILSNPGNFTRGKVENFRAIVDEIKDRLEKYGLPKGISMSEVQINKAFIRHLKALTSGSVANLKSIMKEVKGRVKKHGLPEGIKFTETELEKKFNIAIIRNPRAFTNGTVVNLKEIIKEIKNRVKKYGLPEGVELTETELEKKFNIVIIRNPRAFTNGTAGNLRLIAEEIKSQVKEYELPGERISEEMIEKEINKAILSNIEAFTRGKIENLKAIMQEIKDRVKKYGLPEGTVLSGTIAHEMLTKNTAAFTRGSVMNLKAIAKEIKDHLKTLGFTEAEIEMKINEAIINNTEYFTKLTIKNLTALEKHFGINGLIENLRNASVKQLEEIVVDASEATVIQNQENIETKNCPPYLLP